MRKKQIQMVLSFLLCLTILLSLLPTALAEELVMLEDDNGAYTVEGDDESFVEMDIDDSIEAPVRVHFLPDPPDAQITVYDPWQLDEFGEPVVFFPELDGIYWLTPGEYLVDVECGGYESLLGVPLTVAYEPLELPVLMSPIDAHVSVVFTYNVAEPVITVYNTAETSQNGEPALIEPEEDGTYLLLPGVYFYDAAVDGFETLTAESFEVRSGEPLEIALALTVISNVPAQEKASLNDIETPTDESAWNGTPEDGILANGPVWNESLESGTPADATLVDETSRNETAAEKITTDETIIDETNTDEPNTDEPNTDEPNTDETNTDETPAEKIPTNGMSDGEELVTVEEKSTLLLSSLDESEQKVKDEQPAKTFSVVFQSKETENLSGLSVYDQNGNTLEPIKIDGEAVYGSYELPAGNYR